MSGTLWFTIYNCAFPSIILRTAPSIMFLPQGTTHAQRMKKTRPVSTVVVNDIINPLHDPHILANQSVNGSPMPKLFANSSDNLYNPLMALATDPFGAVCYGNSLSVSWWISWIKQRQNKVLLYYSKLWRHKFHRVLSGLQKSAKKKLKQVNNIHRGRKKGEEIRKGTKEGDKERNKGRKHGKERRRERRTQHVGKPAHT